MTLADYAAQFSHNAPCPSPEVVEVTGRQGGDPGLFCNSCQRIWFPPALARSEDVPAEETEPTRPEPQPQNIGRLLAAAWFDAHDHRQSLRSADGWPRHRARKRGRRRRKIARERDAA